MPFTFAAFVVGGLGLIGVPLTVGFVSKWLLVRAAFEADFAFIAALILASSLLAVIYIWRVVEVAYFEEPPPGRGPVREAPLSMLVPLWVLAGSTIWFGIDTELTVGLAERAARALVGAPAQIAIATGGLP